MPATANLVQIVLNGGYAPATAGNPRPYGMPPFMLVLSDTEVASLLTYLRSAWGNQAGEVSALDVNRARGGPQR
jgi:mono/diheme cytochrome c family protein